MRFRALLGWPLVDLMGGMVRLSKEHAAIHLGESFGVTLAAGALGAGASVFLHLVVPKGYEVHLKSVRAMLDQALTLKIESVGDATNQGTTPAAITRYQQTVQGLSAQRQPVAKVYSAVGATGALTVLDSVPLLANQDVDLFKNDDEMQLGAFAATDGYYRITLTNNSASPATRGFLKLRWYEENL